MESSACRFSSASRARALSTSKMPPQQPDGLLDGIDVGLSLCAHESNACLSSSLGLSDADARTQPLSPASLDGSDRPRCKACASLDMRY